MTDDIVKRLRAIPAYADFKEPQIIEHEAADEIKRLRAALHCIVWMIDTRANIQDIYDCARAALAEEKK
jgi:hypothetical protein